MLRSRQLAGYKLRRQHPIGPIVADFACVTRLLVVEADGGQHADNTADVARAVWLEAQGWQVLRFWNNDILGDTEGVLTKIPRTPATEPPA